MADMNLSQKNKQILIVVGVVIAFILLAGGIFFFKSKKPTTAAVENKDLAQIISKVGQIIELPTGETPTLATVSDTSQLLGQPFFAQARVGDKVLIYLQAKKAILYRPSTNKIINVGPVNVNKQPTGGPSGPAQNTTGQPTPAQKLPIKVSIYNGTETSGLATKFSADLKSKIPDVTFDITSTKNASKSDYSKTLIIDLKGNNNDTVRQIAQSVKGISDKLPEAEIAPDNADILIIIGNDYVGSAVTPTSSGHLDNSPNL